MRETDAGAGEEQQDPHRGRRRPIRKRLKSAGYFMAAFASKSSAPATAKPIAGEIGNAGDDGRDRVGRIVEAVHACESEREHEAGAKPIGPGAPRSSIATSVATFRAG